MVPVLGRGGTDGLVGALGKGCDSTPWAVLVFCMSEGASPQGPNRKTHPMRGWRNRQTRWIQVPVPERAWGFNSPLAHSTQVGGIVEMPPTSAFPGSRGVRRRAPASVRKVSGGGGVVRASFNGVGEECPGARACARGGLGVAAAERCGRCLLRAGRRRESAPRPPLLLLWKRPASSAEPSPPGARPEVRRVRRGRRKRVGVGLGVGKTPWMSTSGGLSTGSDAFRPPHVPSARVDVRDARAGAFGVRGRRSWRPESGWSGAR